MVSPARALLLGALAVGVLDLLGVLLHFGIAFAIVAFHHVAARRVSALARRPFVWGPLYGLAVYAVMNVIVIPLSAARGGVPALVVLINGVLIHLVGVGLPAALSARAATRSSRGSERDRGIG